MRNFKLLTSSGLIALSLAACAPPHPHGKGPRKVISTLDCPDTQGDLTRKSAATDGNSCVYATEGGDQVTLQLIALDGKDPHTALAPLETQLKSELPAVADPPKTPDKPEASDKDSVDINLPGIHIHARGDGHTDVDTAGVHVNANGHGARGDHADVEIGDTGDGHGVTVNATDGGAQIRMDERGSGFRARYILASETAGPHGYRMAGYEARGPSSGPIVVAQVLAKSHDHDDLSHDVRQLLRRNVGG